MIEVIKRNANQTNLLALHTCCQMRQLGQESKELVAIVAYEVRSFASKTQDSKEEIHNTINNLITASKDAVDVMA